MRKYKVKTCVVRCDFCNDIIPVRGMEKTKNMELVVNCRKKIRNVPGWGHELDICAKCSKELETLVAEFACRKEQETYKKLDDLVR